MPDEIQAPQIVITLTRDESDSYDVIRTKGMGLDIAYSSSPFVSIIDKRPVSTTEVLTARRELRDAIEYITHKGLYADYLALTGKETPL